MVNVGGAITRIIMLKAWFCVNESKFLFEDLFEFLLIPLCCVIILYDGFYLITLDISNGLTIS